jgi:hypothetical protein
LVVVKNELLFGGRIVSIGKLLVGNSMGGITPSFGFLRLSNRAGFLEIPACATCEQFWMPLSLSHTHTHFLFALLLWPVLLQYP